MPKDNQTPKELKVTDKRIFTPDGEIREEFKRDITPASSSASPGPAAAPPPGSPEPREERRTEERRRSVADKATNPGTPFTNFVEPLIAQAYMSLGMLKNPYQPQATVDAAAARQMIEILTLLKEKTEGNLTPDEGDFLDTHLGELKLAYVQRTKSI